MGTRELAVALSVMVMIALVAGAVCRLLAPKPPGFWDFLCGIIIISGFTAIMAVGYGVVHLLLKK